MKFNNLHILRLWLRLIFWKKEDSKSKEFLERRAKQNETGSNIIKDVCSLHMIYSQKEKME